MLNDLQIIQIVARRLQGDSWGNIAPDVHYNTGQKLRRHVRMALFPQANERGPQKLSRGLV